MKEKKQGRRKDDHSLSALCSVPAAPMFQGSRPPLCSGVGSGENWGKPGKRTRLAPSSLWASGTGSHTFLDQLVKPHTGPQSAGPSPCPRLTPPELWSCSPGLAPSTPVRNGWSVDSILYPAGSNQGTLAEKLYSEVPP